MPSSPVLPPVYRLVALDAVGSTNEEAKHLARAGAEDGTLVWARSQAKGRGRGGRDWASPPGNLYLSLVLRPDCPPARAPELSFVAALALGATIGSLLPPLVELRYKWPNDVLVSGRKIGGILLEAESTGGSRIEWLVLGVGLNVATFPAEARLPATSLRAEGAAEASVEEALQSFARHFLSWTNRWLADGFGPVRDAWLAHAVGLGEPIVVRLPNQELHGTFVDLDRDGALVLKLPSGGIRRVTSGDVFLAGQAAG